MYRQQLAAESARAHAVAAAAADADAVYQEVLQEQEEELAMKAETDSNRLMTAQRTAAEVCGHWMLLCDFQAAVWCPRASINLQHSRARACVCVLRPACMPAQTQVKLRAEANILLRSNNRLKGEKAADAARITALQQQHAGLQQQLADAGAVADKLRAELRERDGVITDNYATMQGLRRRVQELETHKFVLTHKVWRMRGRCDCWLATTREPCARP